MIKKLIQHFFKKPERIAYLSMHINLTTKGGWLTRLQKTGRIKDYVWEPR
jgi:hypothetical protein